MPQIYYQVTTVMQAGSRLGRTARAFLTFCRNLRKSCWLE